MKKYIRKLVERKEVLGIICNWCGSETDISSKYPLEYLEIKKAWGYNSDFDGQTHTFHICLDCYKKMISQFSIKPEIHPKELSLSE